MPKHVASNVLIEKFKIIFLSVFYLGALLAASDSFASKSEGEIGKSKCLKSYFNNLFQKVLNLEGLSSTPGGLRIPIDHQRMASLLDMPMAKLFPQNSQKKYFFWEYDSSTLKSNLRSADDAYELLGIIISGMDKKSINALLDGTMILKWKMAIEKIKNGGKINNINIDNKGSYLSIECGPSICSFLLTNPSINKEHKNTLSRFERTFFRQKFEPENFQHLLYHQLPEGLPNPSPLSKNYGIMENGNMHYTLNEVKKYFREEREFFQFVDLLIKIGFDNPIKAAKYFNVNGYHRGSELIIEQVKKFGDNHQAIKDNLLALSDHQEISAVVGTIPKLKFKNINSISIYRGTTLSEGELARIFRMEWKDYGETFNPGKSSSSFSDFGGGKYFSIDKSVAQRFVLNGHNNAPNVRTENYYSILIEAKVPPTILRKDSEMSRWAYNEFQYDPDIIRPEEISQITLYLDQGKTVAIPGELLLNKQYEAIKSILIDAGLSKENIQGLLGE